MYLFVNEPLTAAAEPEDPPSPPPIDDNLDEDEDLPDVPGDDDDEEEEEDEDGDDGKEIPDELKQEAEKRATESSKEGEFTNQIKLSKLYIQIVMVVMRVHKTVFRLLNF